MKDNITNLLIWLSIGALPFGIAPGVLIVHTAVWIYVFISCYFIEKMYQQEEKSQYSWKYMIIIVVCFALGIIGDVIILLGCILPAFIIAFYLWFTNEKHSKFCFKLFLVLIAGFLLGIVLEKLYLVIGGADKNSYLSNTGFKNIDEISASFILYVQGLLGLLNADFSGRTVLYLTTILNLLRFLIVIYGLYVVIINIIDFFKRKNEDVVSVILSIGFVILSMCYIFTSLSININTTRYYAYSPILFSVLISRYFFYHQILAVNISVYKIPIRYLVLVFCSVLILGIVGRNPLQKWSIDTVYNPYVKLKDVLIENGLENGYSGFWDASITTVTSRNQIKVRHIIDNGGYSSPYYWFCKKNWYAEFANFVVIRDGYGGITEKNISSFFGTPYRILTEGEFIIYIYNRDISKDFLSNIRH